MPQDLLDIFLLRCGNPLNFSEDSADVGLMKMQRFFMNTLCCIAVLAEVQLAGYGGIMHNQQCSSSAESPAGVQCLYLIAEEGKGGVIWYEGAGVSRQRQDRILFSYSVTNITGWNSSTAFLFSLV